LGKPLAALIATWRVLWRVPPLDVAINGRRQRLALMFVGNSHYSPDFGVPRARVDMADGLLDVRLLEADRRLRFARLVRSNISRRLPRSHVYSAWTSPDLTISVTGQPAEIALDGEVKQTSSEFRFSKAPAALTVYWPGAVANAH
jgi:diacylglycerol kinase family enzyme